MKKNVAEIFEKRPEQWGLRGDPYSEEDFQQEFFRSFERLTGVKLDLIEDNNIPRYIHIPRYSHGGMSSGCICMDFWSKIALPILNERLDSLSQENMK